MAIRTDEVQLRVLIDGSPARKELAQLSQGSIVLYEHQAKLKAAVDAAQKAFHDANSAVKDHNAVTKEEKKAIQEANNAYQVAIQELHQHEKAMKANTARQAELRKEIGVTALQVPELQKRLRELNMQLRAMGDGPERVKLEKELLAVKQRLQELTSVAGQNARVWAEERRALQLSDMTMAELRKEAQHLSAALDQLHPERDARQFTTLRTELGRVENRMATLRSGMGPFGRMWTDIKGQVMGAGAVVGAFFAGGAIVNGMRNLVRGSAEMSDALADVRRTTGLTAKEVQELSSELGRIDTRTSRAELLALATDAGKLGITGKDNLLQFVKAGDQIRVALGEDLGEDAIKSIGKLNQTFKVGEATGKDLGGQMLATGSAINALGQSSTAAESYLVDFSTRMAGVNQQSGISLQSTLGYAAALDQLGLQAETSSTALAQFTVGAFKDTATYAQVAGMETEKFAALLGANANEAILRVLEGLNGNNAGMQTMVEKLGLLDEEGARAISVLSGLASNTQLVRDQQAIANAEFEKGTSITNEFTVKNTTLAAELDKLGKEFNKVFASRTLTDFMVGAVRSFASFIGFLRDNREAITALAKAITVAVTSIVAYRVATAAAMAVERGALALKISNRAATLLFAAAKAVLTGNTTRAAAAMRLFNASMAANPIGLAVAAVTALVGAFISFGDEVKAVSDELVKLSEERIGLNQLFESIKNANAGSSERAALIRQLNEQYGQYLPGLLNEKASLQEIEQAQRGANAALATKIQLQARAEVIGEAQKKAVEAQARVEKAQAELDELRARAAELNSDSDGQGDWMYGRRIEKEAKALEDLKKEATELMNYYEAVEQRLSGKKSAFALPKLDDGTGWDSGANTDDMGDAIVGDPKAVQAKAEEVVRTVKWLNEQIKALRDQQENTSDRAGWLKLEQQAKTLEAERDRITGAAASKRAGKTAEDLNALLEQYRKFQQDMALDQLGADEKEIAELDSKHTEELRKVQEQQAKLIAAKKLSPEQAATDLSQLQGQQTDARANLIEEQGEKRLAVAREADARYIAERRKTSDAVASELDRAHIEDLQGEVEKWDSVIEEARNSGLDYSEAERQRYAAQEKLAQAMGFNEEQALIQHFERLITTAKQYGIDTTELEDAAARAKTAIQEKQHRQEETRETEHQRRMRQIMAGQGRQYADVLGNVGQLFTGLQQYREAQVAAEEERADMDGKRTKEEIARINARKAAARNAALIQIYTQMGVAIANGVANAMTMQPWPVAVAAAAATVGQVMGLMAQANAIAGGSGNVQNQATGTTTQVGEKGIKRLEGPRHTDGGMGVYDERTGRRKYELEGGEAVINRDVVDANEPLIDAMLAAAHKPNKQLDQAVLNQVLTPAAPGQPLRYTMLPTQPAQVNLSAVRRALAAERFALGGVIQPAPHGQVAPRADRQPSAAPVVVSGGEATDMGETNRLLRQLITETQDNTNAVRRSREFNQGYDRAKKRWDLLKESNTAKRHRA